jgi:TP901 family phage tail tape measure protein
VGAAGSLALSVYPVATDWVGSLTAQTVGPSAGVGAKAGKSFSDAFAASSTKGGAAASTAIATEAQTAADAVAKASQGVVAARAREETAAGRVKVAEQQLAEARTKFGAGASQVTAAEEKLAAATRNVQIASGNSELASTKLTRARQAEADASKVTVTATESESAALGKWKTIASDSNSTIGGLISQYGALGAMVGVAVVVGIGVKAVQAASNFQTSQERLVTTAGETQSALAGVSSGILAMAGQVGYTAQQISTGMYTVESAGFHGADALTVMKAAAQGAKEENADLGTVTNAVTSVIQDYGLKATDAAMVTSKLVTAVSLGKTTFQDLTGSLSAVLPKAAALGLSLPEVTGDLASMTLHGMSAQQAADNLADAIGHLSNPTLGMTKEMASLGLTSSELSQKLGKTGVQGTMTEIATAILQHMGPAGTTLLNAFNQSTVAATDANTEYKALPPALQTMADGYTKGTTSVLAWRTQLRAMPADQQNLITQWRAAQDSANGFNAALKGGGNAAQTFSQALQKATGDSASMNVALMLTGTNGPNAAASIRKVASASTEAGGNVKGWADIQQTLNQKIAEIKDGIGAWVTQLGTKLVPVVTAVANGLAGLIGFLVQNRVWVGLLAAMVGGLVVGLVAFKIASLASAAATWLVTTAQKAATLASIFMTDGFAGLNAVMDANVFVIIALAIIALVAGVIYAYTHFQTFRNIVNDIANFFKVVFLAVFHAVGDVIDWLVGHWKIFAAILAVAFLPVTVGVGLLVLLITHLRQVGAVFAAVGDAIAIGAKAIGSAFVWLWNVILHPIFNVIMDIVVIVAKILIAIFVVPIVIAVQELGKVFVWLYNVAIKPAFDAISFAARVFSAALQGAFMMIGDAVSFVYDHTLLVIWHAMQTDWLLLEDALSYLYNTVIKPIWTLVGAIFSFVYQNVIRPIWVGLKLDWMILQAALQYLYDNVIRPIWQAIGSVIETVYHSAMEPIWAAFKLALAGLKDAFSGAVSGIQTAWNVLEKVFGTPIEFVIRTVLNNGLIKGINDLLKVVGISGIPNVPDPNLPTFATGGYVPGTGTGDTVHALLTPGEGVLTANATRTLGGAAGIQALNAALGGSGGGPTMLGGMPAFGLGGLVSDIISGIGHAASSAWNAVSNVVLGGLRAGASAFFDDVVKPLVNLIPNAPDGTPGLAKQTVMGFVSTLENDLLTFFGAKDASAPKGGGPIGGSIPSGSRLAILTQALAADGVPAPAWPMWEAGLNTLITRESGWNPNAVNNTDSNAKAGHPSTGLMQTIIGTFEANRNPAFPDSMTNPVANVAAGVNYIIKRYGSISNVQQANAAMPPKGYDAGGMLPPGVSMVANMTGRPEPVFSPSQWDTMRSAAGQGSAPNTHNYFITSTDPVSVAYELERREAAHMRAKL